MAIRKLLVALLVIALALAIGSCKKEAAQNKQLTKLRVLLDWTPNTNHAGLYVARDLGYFAEEGLEVEIIQPGSNTVESIVAAGKAEFGFSYQESVTLARAQAEPIRIKSVAAVIQHNTSGFAALESSGIKSPKDFAGKRYGSSGWPSELDILRQVLDAEGIAENKVEIVQGVYDFQSTIGKDADFEWIYYGWDGIQAGLQGNKIKFMPIRDIDPVFDFYTPVIISSDDYLAGNGDTAKAFLKALGRGYDHCAAQPAKSAELLCKAVPELDARLVAASLEYLAGEFKADAPRWGEQREEVWQRFADWMLSRGLISAKVPATEFFSNGYLP